ncbi:MAG: hypothetical protein DI586_10055 [Micavibrio aeruginosavorus]|uniref:AAA+ ATPase domain-containing protein n=1 Tax=Micavibrio aeruginosavorus TaxID=349221 RepID=A0A2W5H8G5_9BACT|nr:MAG: hypothetical protein DI586_10055 [Micavibrio aeruginosavorus]
MVAGNNSGRLSMVKSAKRNSVAITQEMANALLDGDDGYGTYLAYQYYYNLVRTTPLTSQVAYKICHVFEDNLPYFDDLELEGKKFPNKKPKGKGKPAYPEDANPGKNSVLEEDWNHIKAYLEKYLAEYTEVPEKTTIFRNIDILAQTLYLDDSERDILTFLYIAQNDHLIMELSQKIVDKDPGRMLPLMSRYLNKTGDNYIEALAKAMDVNAPLTSNGMIVIEDIFERPSGLNDQVFPQIQPSLQELLPLINLNAEAIAEMRLGKPVEAMLSTQDFSDLTPEISRIKTILKQAAEQGKTGINILLHGPSGSGKTELAKALSAELGFDMFAIGESDEIESSEKGTDTSFTQRVGDLLQAHSFLKDRKGVLLFFDELEDLLTKGTDTDKKSDPPSKIIINRLLETNPVPTVWAGNNPEKFHDSFRQRFSYSVYVGYPPVMKRAAIWRRQAAIHDVALSEKDILSLARRFEAPGRMIANAIHMASLTEVTLPNIEAILRESSRIVYGNVEAIEADGGISRHFRRSLFNYDRSKHNYVSEIYASGSSPRPYSIFVKGVPGSGIRSFGRLLAEKGNMNPIETDMRGLAISTPVSSAESNIRKAFADATDNRGLLIISHLEGLCENSQASDAKWQKELSYFFAECVSKHELPVLMSSYKPDLVVPEYVSDVFSLDLKIHALDAELCARAYEEYFGEAPKEDAAFPKGLVPGDFARVSHVLKKDLNGGAIPEKIMNYLRKQVELRESQNPRFGF